MKKPDEINMNAENAFLLREAANAHSMGYYDHLANGGKGDPAEERWIEALNAGADALSYIQQLEREKDAAVKALHGRCFQCKHNGTSVCIVCGPSKERKHWEWRGVKEDE